MSTTKSLAARMKAEADALLRCGDIHEARKNDSAAAVADRARELLLRFAADVTAIGWKSTLRSLPAAGTRVMIVMDPFRESRDLNTIMIVTLNNDGTWELEDGSALPTNYATHWQPWVCPDDTDGDGNCGRPACRWCEKAMA